MRIALIGANGQLGSQLRSVLRAELIPLGRAEVDIAESEQVESALDRTAPQIVVNTAAYNLVDRAEDEPETAYRVNALGPRNLAIWCGRHEVPLLHVSTDYVFSGRVDESGAETIRSVPYTERDCPAPLSAYGVSKLAGEWYVRQHCWRHYVVRTCGLYGRAVSRGGGNFVETMLRLGREGRTVRVVNDQQCTPTSTSDLADAITALIETEAYGLYHATNDGATTWYEFAQTIFRVAELDVDLRPISSAEYGAKAPRSLYSVLDIGKLTATIGTRLRPWQEALTMYLADSGP